MGHIGKKPTVAYWVETLAAGAGHWRIIHEAYKETKSRGFGAIVLSATSQSATDLYPFDKKDIKQLHLPEGDQHYYRYGDTNLPKPDEALQQDYAQQMIRVLSRHNIAAFVTEQQPMGNINRGWFLKPLGQVYDYLESKSPKPVLGAIVRSNTLGSKEGHFQGGVTGPEEVIERVKRLDFIAVRGLREVTDLADYADAARDPEVAEKIRYVGYFTPQVEAQEEARAGIVVTAGSNWFPDNPEVYVHAVQSFQWLDEDLQRGGMRVLIPRDSPAGVLDLLTAMAHDVEAASEGRITVGYNLKSREFEKLLTEAELFVLRPGNTASEAIVHGGNVVVIPQILGKDPEQIIRGISLARNGMVTLALVDAERMQDDIREAALEKISAHELDSFIIANAQDFAELLNTAHRHPPEPKVEVSGKGASRFMDILEEHIEAQKGKAPSRSR